MFNYMYGVSVATLGLGVFTMVDPNASRNYMTLLHDLLPL